MESAAPPEPKDRLPSRLGWIFLGLLAIALTRRFAQFAFPQVWDEEGTIFKGFLDHGWAEFLRPVNGYFITLPKLLVWVGYRFAFSHMPLVSALLAWAYALGVGLLVAWAPTSLERKGLCALALFAVPADPEVFGIALYCLWWTTIPVFIALLWESTARGFWLRLGFIAVSALSSPALPALLPFFYWRVFRGRSRACEAVLAAAATLLCLVQVYAVLHRTDAPAVDPAPFAHLLRQVPVKFVGMFLTGGLTDRAWPPIVAAGVLVLTAAWALRVDAGLRERRLFLLLLILASIAMSCLRTPVDSLHPTMAGPRYFFYAFTLESWLLLQLTASGSKPLRWLAAGLLVLAAANALSCWSRSHVDLQWTESALSGPQFREYNLPVEAGGDRGIIYGIDARGASIAEALSHDLTLPVGRPTLPYRITQNRAMPLADQALEAYRPRQVYAGVEAVTLLLRKGARIAYLPSPGMRQPAIRIVGDEAQLSGTMPVAGGWIFLDFDNRDLAAGFQARIEGGDPGWKVALFQN